MKKVLYSDDCRHQAHHTGKLLLLIFFLLKIMCLCNSQPEISNSDLPDAVLEKQEGLCHEEAADAVVMVLNTLRSIRLNAA